MHSETAEALDVVLRQTKIDRRRCAVVEQAGKDVGPGSGPYHICLSPNQARTLFGPKKGPLLGCGAWACVWGRGPKRVAKITRDPEDVASIKKGQGLRHVVKVYDMYTLKNAGRDIHTGKRISIYGIIAERLDPVPDRMGNWIKNTLCPTKISLRIDVTRFRGSRKNFRVSPITYKKANKACAKERDAAGCRKFSRELLKTFEALYHRGIDWQDMHEGNIFMTKQGVWKVIDLGLSDVRLRKKPPVIRGATCPVIR